ncbi:unnamed protein product [Dovyalis caffra]|uniref:Ubiquitin-like protease family profile domain-containing protein n=1 Tax=Dovyalis caffra TaxID=77055 RepID=A0AAV1RIQ9_9ROSI|nr:unnamed protein product [Dovyalis caffra]
MAKRKREDEISTADTKSPISDQRSGRVPLLFVEWNFSEEDLRVDGETSVMLDTYDSAFISSGKKITKQEAANLRSFKLTSQCFLGTFPCSARSKRRIRAKNAILEVAKEKKKLDSGAFDCYFEKGPDMDQEEANLFEEICSCSHRLLVRSHWSLLIFCHLGESLQSQARTPCLLLLDSLEKAGPRSFEPDIRKFVLDIYKSEGRAENKELISQIPLLVPKVPQQRNGEECGNYVLYFINLFVQEAPENFRMDGYPYFMKQNWFSSKCLEVFFEKLDQLKIWSFVARTQEGRNGKKPDVSLIFHMRTYKFESKKAVQGKQQVPDNVSSVVQLEIKPEFYRTTAIASHQKVRKTGYARESDKLGRSKPQQLYQLE